jgi:hypothetical protein
MLHLVQLLQRLGEARMRKVMAMVTPLPSCSCGTLTLTLELR